MLRPCWHSQATSLFTAFAQKSLFQISRNKCFLPPLKTPSEGTKILRQGKSVIQSVRPQSLSRSSRLSASHTHWHVIVQDSLLQPQDNFNSLLIPFDPHFRFIFCAHSQFCFSLTYFSLATTSWCTTAQIAIQVSFHSYKAHTLLPTQFSLWTKFWDLPFSKTIAKKDVVKRFIGWKMPAKCE